MSARKNIIECARRADNDGVKRALEADVTAIRAKDPVNGFTALHYAAYTGNLDLVTFLVEYKAPLYEKDIEGRWPVQLASRSANPELIAYLERATFDIIE